MPVVSSSFRPPWHLRNGHAQTLLAGFVARRMAVDCRRERIELPDGDFLDADWVENQSRRLAIFTHGLEANSANHTIRTTSALLKDAGWDSLAWNFRGCGGEINRLPRFYHSGDTADLAFLVERAASRYESIALVGFSLGGNVTLKYLGEAAPHPSVKAAVAISVPADLASSARVLDTRLLNRIYLGRFIKSLVKKVKSKAPLFPEAFDLAGIDTIRSFREFDDRFTARIHGFRDAEDYWTRSSSRQFLPAISLPTLLVNALDDPFLGAESFPFEEAAQNPHLVFECPRHGGHIGFMDDAGFWCEKRIVEFLNSAM